MKSTLVVIALGLLSTACVPHDPNEIEPDMTPWGTPRTQPSVSHSIVTQSSYPQKRTIIVQQTPQGKYVTQQKQVVAQKAPQVRYVQTQPQKVVVQQAPQVQYVQPRPVIVEQPRKKESWWKQNKQRHVVSRVVPTCPCQDPNDPCTHCYQK